MNKERRSSVQTKLYTTYFFALSYWFNAIIKITEKSFHSKFNANLASNRLDLTIIDALKGQRVSTHLNAFKKYIYNNLRHLKE